VALLVGRTLGVVLMMVGAAIHYGLSTWVTKMDVVLGFPDLLVLLGIALLVDPWDIVWNTLRPLFLRLTTDSDEPVVWDLTIPDVLTRALRVPWGAAAAAATALSLATIYWWPMWILIATVPAALATMAYAIAGRNRHIVQLVAPVFTGIAQLLSKPLPASTTATADSSPPGTR
jgi:putative Mn2+ efflux pump MntP